MVGDHVFARSSKSPAMNGNVLCKFPQINLSKRTVFASARWEWQYLPRNLPVGYKWCRSKADWEDGRTGWLQQTAFRADVEKSSKKRTSLLPCPPRYPFPLSSTTANYQPNCRAKLATSDRYLGYSTDGNKSSEMSMCWSCLHSTPPLPFPFCAQPSKSKELKIVCPGTLQDACFFACLLTPSPLSLSLSLSPLSLCIPQNRTVLLMTFIVVAAQRRGRNGHAGRRKQKPAPQRQVVQSDSEEESSDGASVTRCVCGESRKFSSVRARRRSFKPS